MQMNEKVVCVCFAVGNNAEHLDKIHKSIFILCLDKPYSSTQDQNADAFSLSARQMLYGDGSKGASCNRWFDKTIQVSLMHVYIVCYVACQPLNWSKCAVSKLNQVCVVNHQTSLIVCTKYVLVFIDVYRAIWELQREINSADWSE